MGEIDGADCSAEPYIRPAGSWWAPVRQATLLGWLLSSIFVLSLADR